MRQAQYPIRTSVVLSEALYRRLKVLSDKRAVSLGEQFRTLLLLGLEHEKSASEKGVKKTIA